MSVVGPPALSSILVQRLDAVLGTSMSAYANLLNGARPDAVAPPADPEKNPQLDQNGQPILPEAQGDTAQQIANAKTAATLSLAARGLITRTDLTPSAPTTLGATARTILALLAQSPDKAPPSLGKAPLWPASSGNQDEPQTTAGSRSGQTPAMPAPIGQQTQSAVQPAGQQPENPQEQQSNTPSSSNQPASPASGSASSRASQQASPPLAAGQTAGTQSATASTTQAAQLTQALRAALQQTGLFYESHLTQMAFGQRSVQELAKEPQAQLAQDAVITRDTPMPANAQASQAPTQNNIPIAPSPLAHNAAAAPQNGATTGGGGSSTSLSLSSSAATGGNPLAGIHPGATTLVHQQLDVLANQALVWQGQAWPGAHMEWEVARDRTQGGELMADDHWATRLQIELPNLGLVQARLNLAGNQIVMSLVAPSSAGILSQNSNALRQQFVATGLALSQLTVDTQPPSPFDLS